MNNVELIVVNLIRLAILCGLSVLLWNARHFVRMYLELLVPLVMAVRAWISVAVLFFGVFFVKSGGRLIDKGQLTMDKGELTMDNGQLTMDKGELI
ncbi:MAG: hypothetical protein WCK32_00900 [Chlorobiaceae bacterium]